MDTDGKDYQDIIHLPHHVSPTRPRMSMTERASQFAPFAALTGHDAAIRETARLTQSKIQLDEDVEMDLDRKHQIIMERISEHPELTITYFQPDGRKDGGSYQSVTGRVKGMDPYARVMVLTTGLRIPLDNILQMESPMFDGLCIE